MSVSSLNSFSITTIRNNVSKASVEIEDQDCFIYWNSNSSYMRNYRDKTDWSVAGTGSDVEIDAGGTVSKFGPIRFFNDLSNFFHKYSVNSAVIGNHLRIFGTNCDGTNDDNSFYQTYSDVFTTNETAQNMHILQSAVVVTHKNSNGSLDLRFYSYKGSEWNVAQVNQSLVSGSDYYYISDVAITSTSKYSSNNNELYITGLSASSTLRTLILTPTISGGELTVGSQIIQTAVNASEIIGAKYYDTVGFIGYVSETVSILRYDNLDQEIPLYYNEALTTISDGNLSANSYITFTYKMSKYLFTIPDIGLVGEVLTTTDSDFIFNETNNQFQNTSTMIMDVTASDQPDIPVYIGTNSNTSLNTMIYVSDFGPVTDSATLGQTSLAVKNIAHKTTKNDFFVESTVADNGVQTLTKYNLTGTPPVKAAQTDYTVAGSYSFTVPPYVYKVSAVIVGGGGGGGSNGGSNGPGGSGGGGGALCYKNNWVTIPTSDMAITVGAGGTVNGGGSDSTIVYNAVTITAGGGSGGSQGNTNTTAGGIRTGGDGGGNGGTGGPGGPDNGDDGSPGAGGGAAGYSGNGGNGGQAQGGSGGTAGTDGQGGGGGGGGGGNGNYEQSAGGGGVGLLGEGSNGAGGGASTSTGQPNSGKGGSGGEDGITGGSSQAWNGGNYGGGGGAKGGSQTATPPTSGSGGGGACRIIWGGLIREYPSTNTGDL
jgi:hypothetical protein